MEDLFTIEDEISAAIVATLRIKLIARSGGLAVRHGARDLGAHAAFLKGRYYWNKRTVDGLTKGLQYFRQAIEFDPSFAPGFAGLADSYTLHAEYGLMPPEEAIPKARAAARKALEIDPELGEAHASLGLIGSAYDWEWEAAEIHYRRSFELNPGYANARHWFAVDHLTMQRRLEEALPEIELAQQLDPLSPIIREGKGYILMVARRYDEAIEEYRQALELDGYFYKGFTSMGRAYAQKGMYAEAIELFQKGRALSGEIPSTLGALGQSYAAAGQTAEARRVLDELAGLAQCRYVPATCFALIHLGLGEYERALDWLEDGAQKHETALAALKVHSVYDPLRADARFQALLRVIRLEPAALSETS